MKIEFSSQRREMLLFLTTSMAAVTSRANQQYCRNLYGQDKSSLLLLFGDVPPGSRVGCPDPGGEGYSPIKVKGYSSHLLGFNKNRRKAIFN